MSDALRAKLDTLDLSADKVRDELARTGQVFRRKAEDIGDKAADAASDARAVSEIKAKYAADSTLSAWNISVACDHGHVTLSGTVTSPQDVGKAVALALEADGVRDVVSKLQVKSSDGGTSKTGARPSSVAATQLAMGQWDFFQGSSAFQVAAPEGGRTPVAV